MHAKSLLNKAATALKFGTSWTEESPYNKQLTLLREGDSLHLAGTLVRRAMKLGRENGLLELLKSSELDLWTRMKLQECCHGVMQDDQRRSMVQQILQKSTGFLRRIIVPVQGQGEVTLSYVCPPSHRFPIADYI